MDRRDFLKFGLGTLGLSASWRLWAASAQSASQRPTQPLLLVVFLRGAYDGLSLLSPYKESFYYESRPTIAIPEPDTAGEEAGVALDSDWALHPAVAASVLPMYKAGELAFVPFAGTSFVSRSHFQAQDWIEAGVDSEAMRVDGGFLNRLVGRLNTGSTIVNGMGFTQTLPLVLKGQEKLVANSPVNLPKTHLSALSEEALWARMYQGHSLQADVDEGLGVRRQIYLEMQEEIQAASRSAVTASGFASQSARIGRFLEESTRFRVAFVDVGGWDTHTNQGNGKGALANRFANLGNGLVQLKVGLGEQWNNTVVVVMSEFGRTFRENGTKGTDHGHGNVMWVMGGSVKGGRVVGNQARLRARDLHENRDVPVLNNNRDVMAGVLKSVYGLSSTDVQWIFPGCHPNGFGLV